MGGNGGGGGGGGGAFAKTTAMSFTTGAAIALSIPAAPTPGNDPANTTFGTTTVVATGGKHGGIGGAGTGGAGGAGGLSSGCTGATVYSGGTGGTGASAGNSYGGGAGQGAGAAGVGANGSGQTGGNNGNGGNPAPNGGNVNINGTVGAVPNGNSGAGSGGGGGGSYNANSTTGGNGSAAQISVYIPDYSVAMAGGDVDGGAAGVAWSAHATMAGGDVDGGAVVATWQCTELMSGGDVDGGAVVATWQCTELMSGGDVDGGAAVVSSSTYMGPTVYGNALRQLLPPGAPFAAPTGSQLYELTEGSAVVFDNFVELADNLLNEFDPRTAMDFLSDWERVYDLPGTNPSPPATIAGRQAALLAKAQGYGNPTPAYFIALAAALGYTATITTYAGQLFTCDSACNASVYGDAWMSSWVLNASSIPATDATLRWLITSLAPAHTAVGFNLT